MYRVGFTKFSCVEDQRRWELKKHFLDFIQRGCILHCFDWVICLFIYISRLGGMIFCLCTNTSRQQDVDSKVGMAWHASSNRVFKHHLLTNKHSLPPSLCLKTLSWETASGRFVFSVRATIAVRHMYNPGLSWHIPSLCQLVPRIVPFGYVRIPERPRVRFLMFMCCTPSSFASSSRKC